jgi:hypothetical protein
MDQFFEFRRHCEGWLECAELLDGNLGSGQAYLSRGRPDEAVVEVSFQEPLRQQCKKKGLEGFR